MKTLALRCAICSGSTGPRGTVSGRYAPGPGPAGGRENARHSPLKAGREPCTCRRSGNSWLTLTRTRRGCRAQAPRPKRPVRPHPGPKDGDTCPAALSGSTLMTRRSAYGPGAIFVSKTVLAPCSRGHTSASSPGAECPRPSLRSSTCPTRRCPSSTRSCTCGAWSGRTTAHRFLIGASPPSLR